MSQYIVYLIISYYTINNGIYLAKKRYMTAIAPKDFLSFFLLDCCRGEQEKNAMSDAMIMEVRKLGLIGFF